ncbi:MAG: hypothetical protein DWQ08_00020 [Proteobacteria bacterium]|nr:MAG: hypothetical protein DWQ08_00020 [Pseudomonadota bacterium]
MTSDSAAGHWRRRCLVASAAIVGVLLLGLCLEAASLVYVYVKTGKVFYFNRPEASSLRENSGWATGRLSADVVERLHPYFGYVALPRPDFRPGFSYNNFGFISPYDYPYEKTDPKDLVIGVFGGSVASGYSIYEIQNGVLADRLARDESLAERRPVFLSLAAGGYKQPQQLVILNYLLSIGQHFDLVINIDGFNEVALSPLNVKRGIDPTMPSVQHVTPLTSLGHNRLSREWLTELLRTLEFKDRMRFGRDAMRNSDLATVYVFHDVMMQRASARLSDTIRDLDRLDAPGGVTPGSSVYYYYASAADPDESNVARRVSEHWEQSSRLMNETLSALGIPYLHVLQPNQYFKTGRHFSDNEKRTALDPDSPYRPGVLAGYPQLIARVAGLAADGVRIADGTAVFDDLDESAYVDSCCHYTRPGEQRFSEFVSEEVVAVLRSHGDVRTIASISTSRQPADGEPVR